MRKAICLVFLFCWLLAAGARAQVFTEYPIPTDTQPETIVAGPDGNLWFTEYRGNKIGRITPTGQIDEFAVPTGGAGPYGAGPHGIAPGPDGNLWFTERLGTKIGRITTDGVITEFPIPSADSYPTGITAGPDGNLWFVESGSNKIGRITPTGVVTEFPTINPDANPQNICLGPDGNLWFTEAAGNRIGRITPGGVMTEFDNPAPNGYPLGIAAGPDGRLWFTQDGAVSAITTQGSFETIITGLDYAYGISAGPDGRVWFTEKGGRVRRVAADGSGVSYTVPTSASYPHSIAPGPDGAMWFTENVADQIGRISTEASPCVPDSESLCLNHERFRVTAHWRKSDGSEGNGHAVALTADSGYFWFFNAANIELVVKVLGACSLNQHYWVFAAGLTNVEVALSVTDMETGAVKTYSNPLGTAFAPVQDTSAFESCP